MYVRSYSDVVSKIVKIIKWGKNISCVDCRKDTILSKYKTGRVEKD